MSNVIEFFSRSIGPVVFAIALTCYFLLESSLDGFLLAAKSEQYTDEVYSQGSIPIEEDVCTYGELLGVLMAGTTQNIRISSPTEFLLIEIQAGAGKDTLAYITRNNKTVYQENYGLEKWDVNSFPYHEIPFSNFRIMRTFKANGTESTISYVKI